MTHTLFEDLTGTVSLKKIYDDVFIISVTGETSNALLSELNVTHFALTDVSPWF